MLSFPAKARTTTDGTLRLAIPTGLPDADVEVLVVLDVVAEPGTQLGEPAQAWPPGYFGEYFGALRDEGLTRQPQGVIEERDPLN
jgi:hypothetical protein